MASEIDDDLLSEGVCKVSEAVKLTGLGKSFLYQQMDKGELAYLRFGRARRIPVKVLKDWMKRHLVGAID